MNTTEKDPLVDQIERVFGMGKIPPSNDKDKIDVDKFTHMIRIHEAHYLLRDEDGFFTIAYKYPKPKGSPGTKEKDQFMKIMIPKKPETEKELWMLMTSMGVNRIA